MRPRTLLVEPSIQTLSLRSESHQRDAIPPATALLTLILVRMETLPPSEVKAPLSELVDRVVEEHERIVITRNGRPAAVLVSPDDLESVEETLAVMSDPELMESIREGLRDIEQGNVLTLRRSDAAISRTPGDVADHL
jgi:prevent-host-death family protein